jgi:hypothetical protein
MIPLEREYCKDFHNFEQLQKLKRPQPQHPQAVVLVQEQWE